MTRLFLCLMVAAAMAVARPNAQNQEFDLLIRNGHVIDPKNGINAVVDVAVTGSKIALVASNIASTRARQVVHATGLYVGPGLIDIHAHVFWGHDEESQYSDGYSPVPSLNCQENQGNRDLINCFDASAFEMPVPFTFGNAPRNVLRGPKSVNTDLSMAKDVPVGGNVRMQVRVDLFNAFNNVNYGNPGSTFAAATFGRISSAGDMRRMQFGLKLTF